MQYHIIINKQVKKRLQALSRPNRNRIVEKIEFLGFNPDDPKLNIKKLKGQSYYRLRVGDWRVLFDRNDSIKVISIEKLDVRGDIYK